MKEIKLTQGYTALVDDEDYQRVLEAGPWQADPKKNRKTVYARRSTHKPDGTRCKQRLHRFILGLTNPKVLTDHIDGDGLNNCRSNLRVATPAQSASNRGKFSNNTSGHTGVYWHKSTGRWVSLIGVGGKLKHLGYFTDKDEAVSIVEAARELLHNDFSSKGRL